MAGVFISYRRTDSDVASGRLADDLSDIFGRDAIFRDIDTLQVGEDYTDALSRALNSCVALIAVIGPSWSTVTDESGRRRLDNPDDWVRREIQEALRRDLRVIPVALTSTMPRDDQVPADLLPLLRRQAVQMTDRHWRQDVELLAQSLAMVPGMTRRRVRGTPRAFTPWRSLLIGAVTFLVAIGGWLGWSAVHERGSPSATGPRPRTDGRASISMKRDAVSVLTYGDYLREHKIDPNTLKFDPTLKGIMVAYHLELPGFAKATKIWASFKLYREADHKLVWSKWEGPVELEADSDYCDCTSKFYELPPRAAVYNVLVGIHRTRSSQAFVAKRTAPFAATG